MRLCLHCCWALGEKDQGSVWEGLVLHLRERMGDTTAMDRLLQRSVSLRYS